MNFIKRLAVITAMLVPVCGHSQIQRDFTERSSFNVRGNITLIGNTLLTCASSASCADVQSGATAVNNNNLDMIDINIDPSAGLTNSSSSDLSMPPGAQVLFAGLYWGGRADETDASRAKISLKTPGQSSYALITADQLDTIPNINTSDSRPYQAMADVTNLVLASGNGTYTAGGLLTDTGQISGGAYGGWSLAVIYQDNNQPFRRLMLFDGAANVGGTTVVPVNVSGLLTPSNGSFDTYIGALSWEGDDGILGDYLSFEGTIIDQNINSDDNFWNGSISAFDAHVTAKSPHYINQLTMDIDMIDVSDLLGNNATTADIEFATSGDGYYPHYLAFVTELYLPDFDSTMAKTALDLNGGNINPGDEIEYTISFENSSQEGATNTILLDAIPDHTTYVPNSIVITAADVGPNGAQTDTNGDDAAEFDAGNNRIVWRLGDGADENNGGVFLQNEGATVKFRVTIDNDAPTGDIINTATISSNSIIFPNQTFTADDSATITLGDHVPPEPPVIINPADGSTINVNQPNISGTAEPHSTVVVTGPDGQSCTAPVNSAGGWSCQLLPALSDGTNLISATATDTAGNTSNASSITLIIDTIPPAAPVCTVMPNPANDGTALTATCTGVETDATVTIPNYVCGIESGNQVICTASAGPGGVTGDETATITDVAGNTATTNVAFTLDNTPPGSPTITAPVDGTTINDNTPLVVGTGEPDSIITVSGPNGETCTTTVDGNGDWSCTLSPALQDGNNIITAVAADEAGNESAPDSITVAVLGGQGYVLVVNAPAELVTTEMGDTDSFEVSLPLTPTADVTVNFTSSDTTEGTVAPGSVTFTTANWDTPVTITVTGVDDTEYDLDQDYQIIIGSLSSADPNYDGFNPDDLDAVNIDDDESPDLSAFMTNCVAGVNPTDTPLYQLVISNVGNKDISGAMVNTVFDDTVSVPDWICQPGAGASCGTASGSGDLVDELVDVPVGSQVTFLFDSSVTGQLMDFIDVVGSVTMPTGETDVNPGNNSASDSDLIYQFMFKDSFECNAPGTIESTQTLWESLNPDS